MVAERVEGSMGSVHRPRTFANKMQRTLANKMQRMSTLV